MADIVATIEVAVLVNRNEPEGVNRALDTAVKAGWKGARDREVVPYCRFDVAVESNAGRAPMNRCGNLAATIE